MENILSLTTEQLSIIVSDLERKINNGLSENGQEIKCLPTYIKPVREISSGKCLVLDWGGTNFRAAIVEFFVDKAPEIIECAVTELSAEKTQGFKREDLFKAMTAEIKKLKQLDKNIKRIGFCFSFAIESLPDGDAKPLNLAKGFVIEGILGSAVGKPLLQYLNDNVDHANFEKIAVINDTIACLFGGLSKAKSDYDAYLGLIVGTGTNMASSMQADKIKKLNIKEGDILINTESGNFNPPFLTYIDNLIDADTPNKGKHRFEKAISGKYLGRIFKLMFPYDEFYPEDFDSGTLNEIVNYPDIYKEKYVDAARCIFERSAKLVAASLAGMIFVLKSQNKRLEKVLLTAEGSLFWCEDKRGTDYHKVVLRELNRLLVEKDYADITVEICKVTDANMIGSAIAAFSLA
ncbi:MAG: hexokinase [Tannerella sp.]|jgi:hexokinase|nr:hexokinase [Tannerella sp.]